MSQAIATTGRLKVLVAHRGLLTQRDEVADLCDTVVGAVEAGLPPDVDLELTDLRYRYRPTVQGGSLELIPIGLLRPTLADHRHYDVALVHEPIPLIHLALAAVLRLRGTTVIHQPINMLSESYRRSTWFAARSWIFRRVRPLLVGLTMLAWRRVASGFLCVSSYEIEDSHLPPSRCRVLRWPRPVSGLAAAALVADAEPTTDAANAPIAFVNRFDWHRKGFDRLCTWLEKHGDELPRPAVLLCAPKPLDAPARLQRLVDAGTIEWNQTATGAALHQELMRCRGLLLLSRYDGQSRILREAALAGLPTISTDDSHFAEVVSALGCGMVVDGDDPAAIRDAFDAIAHHRCSVDAARKLFDRGAIGSELIDILRSFVDAPDPARRTA